MVLSSCMLQAVRQGSLLVVKPKPEVFSHGGLEGYAAGSQGHRQIHVNSVSCQVVMNGD